MCPSTTLSRSLSCRSRFFLYPGFSSLRLLCRVRRVETLHSIIIIGCHWLTADSRAPRLLSRFPPFNYRLFVRLHALHASRHPEFHYVLLRIDRWDRWIHAPRRANFSLVARREIRGNLLTKRALLLDSLCEFSDTLDLYTHTWFPIGVILHLRSFITIPTRKYRHCLIYIICRRINLRPSSTFFFVLTFVCEAICIM